MNLFVVTPVIPFRHHGAQVVTAVNIVTSEVVRALSKMGHKITLQCLYDPSHQYNELTQDEKEEIVYLEQLGIKVLPPFFSSDYKRSERPRRFRTLRILFSKSERLEYFYPCVRLTDELSLRIKNAKSDAILDMWSPEGVALCSQIKGIPKVAYHGDIPTVPERVRLRDRELFSGKQLRGIRNRVRHIDRLIRNRLLLRTHLKAFQAFDCIANIAKCNSDFYTKHGHPHSIYARSTWSDMEDSAGTLTSQERPTAQVPKIIGHAGNLGSTGSTYGLRFLLKEVLPQFHEMMEGRPYELHIIGGGKIVPSLEPFLNHERIILRGFVEDLDSELTSCDLFCIFNNVGDYLATFTRQIIAWSMGLCCVAHERSKFPVPETTCENTIIGSDSEEVARRMVRAVSDSAYNLQVRCAGRETYEKYFKPQLIAATLDRELRQITS